MPINAGCKGEQQGPPVIFPYGTQEQLDNRLTFHLWYLHNVYYGD